VSCREEKEVLILSHCSSNDVSDVSIHTSLMVLRSEKAISTINSKVSKLRVYLLKKTKLFMWWRNHSIALW